MLNFDSFLLKKAQVFSDFTQKWIGLHCIHLGRILLTSYMLFTSIRSIFGLQISFSFFDLVIFIFFEIIMIFICFLYFNRAVNQTQNHNFKNPLEKELLFCRIIYLFIFIQFFILSLFPISSGLDIDEKLLSSFRDFFTNLEYFSLISFFYFISCTPKPYEPSKARQFLDKVLQKKSLSKAMVKS